MSAARIEISAASLLARPPSTLLAITEGPRALVELLAFYAARPAMIRLPQGDGHAVMVLPGFLASDASTRPMRSLLSRLGYDVSGWELGRNLRVDDARVAAISGRLRELHRRTGRKVSIVGWSLGGLLARELAKAHPDIIRQVISLGSPIRPEHSRARMRAMFHALNGRVPAPQRLGRVLDLVAPPPVPSTSIFTRGDGVVAWRGSLQREGPLSENIRVLASHCGMGINPLVMIAVADRLAQPEGQWAKFKPSGVKRLLFPQGTVDEPPAPKPIRAEPRPRPSRTQRVRSLAGRLRERVLPRAQRPGT